MLWSSDLCRCRDLLKNKNRPNPTSARPAAPPTTPPAIAPTGVFPDDLLSVEDVGFVLVAEALDKSADDAVVDRVAVEDVVLVVREEVGVEAVDEEASSQKSLLPGPPSAHVFAQNLMTTMLPLYPPTQWKSVLVAIPLLVGSRDAF